MRLLLDTHALVRLGLEPENLPPALIETVLSPSNDCYLSVASIWEMAIKSGLGKLRLDAGIELFSETVMLEADIALLPIEPEHALKVEFLPSHHRDPFDRLLISQAQIEGLAIVTADTQIAKYDVETLW